MSLPRRQLRLLLLSCSTFFSFSSDASSINSFAAQWFVNPTCRSHDRFNNFWLRLLAAFIFVVEICWLQTAEHLGRPQLSALVRLACTVERTTTSPAETRFAAVAQAAHRHGFASDKRLSLRNNFTEAAVQAEKAPCRLFFLPIRWDLQESALQCAFLLRHRA